MLSVTVAGVLIAAAASAIAARLVGTARQSPGPGREVAEAPCATPQTASPAPVPHSLGRWPFHMLAQGVFSAVASAPHGAVVALQACGADESSLRVVSLSPKGAVLAVSPHFHHIAPVASALAVTSDAVFVGEARLELGASTTEPPYRLSLVELDPRTLAPRRTFCLGRGYGVELDLAGGSGLLVSTGRQLLELGAGGRLSPIAGFPGVVVQHVAAVPGTSLALVSVFAPAAVPPVPATRLALVDLRRHVVVSSLAMPAADEVESLAASRHNALVAVSTGGTTSVEALLLAPRLRARPVAPGGVPSTLTPLGLASGASPAAGHPSTSGSSGTYFVAGSALLGCTAPSGHVLASTAPKGVGEDVSALAVESPGSSPAATGASPAARRALLSAAVVVPAGVGVVEAPSACAPARRG